jgi:hypothetical protein
MVIGLGILGCSGSKIPNSPVGLFEFGSTAFKLDNQKAFWYKHVASADDKKNYTISGTYTYTHDHADEENEISFGKIDVTVIGLTQEGVKVESLDFTPVHSGIDVAVGQKLLGWWKYMNLVTYGGKMQIGLNLPSKGYRPEDVYTGRDWLFIGDPK